MMIARMSPSGQVGSAQPLTLIERQHGIHWSAAEFDAFSPPVPSKQGHAKSDRHTDGELDRDEDATWTRVASKLQQASSQPSVWPSWIRSGPSDPSVGGPEFGLAMAESPKPIRDGIYYFRPHSPHLSVPPNPLSGYPPSLRSPPAQRRRRKIQARPRQDVALQAAPPRASARPPPRPRCAPCSFRLFIYALASPAIALSRPRSAAPIRLRYRR
jgi:hypothetical protein